MTEIDLIKKWEGLRLRAYLCPSGVWTIGYGHTATAKPGRKITQEKADELLLEDVARIRRQVMRTIVVPLTKNQAAAIISLVFNIGVGAFLRSTLYRKLNAGDYIGAADEFDRWVFGGVPITKLPGLVARRAEEKALFLQP